MIRATNYTLEVRVRRQGSTAAYEAFDTIQFEVSPPDADLELTLTSPPFSTERGALTTITDTVKNVGLTSSGSSCSNSYVLNSTPVATRSIASLAPGAARAGSVTFTVPSLTPGQYWVFVTTNCPDLDQDNNRRWIGVRIAR